MEAGNCFDSNMTVKDLAGSHHVTSFVVSDLYLFMGRELELMNEVPAGNVLGKESDLFMVVNKQIRFC